MPPVGFEPAVWAGERPHTHALDGAATGTGTVYLQDICRIYRIIVGSDTSTCVLVWFL
jgi:hypothetical protein